MKRIERNTYNSLRKSITADTINVEIPVEYTHEGRQGIHEMLTTEKGLYVTGINWNSIQGCYCIHYERAYGETAEGIRSRQEAADIDSITEGMVWSDYTWNGYKKPCTETETTEEETETETAAPSAPSADEETIATAEAQTTDTEEEEEEQNMFTNYTEAVTEDAAQYIRDNYTAEEIAEKLTDREEFAETLNDEMWVADEVTGNGSGSYTFDRAQAREYVLADIDTVLEALREFDTPADTIAEKFLDEDWEYFDVTARCYVLAQVIEDAIDRVVKKEVA